MIIPGFCNEKFYNFIIYNQKTRTVMKTEWEYKVDSPEQSVGCWTSIWCNQVGLLTMLLFGDIIKYSWMDYDVIPFEDTPLK